MLWNPTPPYQMVDILHNFTGFEFQEGESMVNYSSYIIHNIMFGGGFMQVDSKQPLVIPPKASNLLMEPFTR